MLKVYKTTSVEKKIKKTKKATQDSWIDLVNPTMEEIEKVVKTTGIEEDMLLKMLDDEERPRIEVGDNETLIVIDTPYLETSDDEFSYITRPLGIIVTDNNYLVTVAPKRVRVLDDFKKNKIKDFRTGKKTRFVIQILLKTAEAYLKDLRSVNKQIEYKEEILNKSTNNKDLLDMLDIEKTLVYFITALKANDLVLEKLSKGNILSLYEDDIDILEDAIVENKQAIDQSTIYREILSSITETYATVVSNNLNNIMKFLAGITIVISIPTMISSFLGMNVSFGAFQDNPIAAIIILIISILLSIIVAIILKRRNML